MHLYLTPLAGYEAGYAAGKKKRRTTDPDKITAAMETARDKYSEMGGVFLASFEQGFEDGQAGSEYRRSFIYVRPGTC